MVSKVEKFNRLRLFRSQSIGPATFWSILSLYETAEHAIKMLPELIDENCNKFQICSEDNANREIENLKKNNIRLVFFEDDLYPPLLREIPSPPPILSFIGNKEKCLHLYKKKFLAIVGTRNASLNGMKLAHELSCDLSKDMCIVSGMARGIDTSAHTGSIGNGTIAILAGGVNVIYPRENEDLFYKISENGGVFSDAPYNTQPSTILFPKRNSIIAGTSHGTLVVEASIKSGSLITASMAKTYKRHIFAIPNSPMDSRSQGCNKLIKEGAQIVTNKYDIYSKIFHEDMPNQQEDLFTRTINIQTKIDVKSIRDIKEKILQLVGAYEVRVHDLLQVINAQPNKILRAIIELELSEKIVRDGGNKIAILCK